MEKDNVRKLVVFADYTCPFSYLTVRSLDAFAADPGITIERRAFELAPAPFPLGGAPDVQHWEMVREVAAAAGVEISRPPVVVRTRKAHEAYRYAVSVGMATALDRAIFDAYFILGADIGRIDVLTRIAESIGMDGLALKVVLDVDRHAEDVEEDRKFGERLEIGGTPAFIAGDDVHVGYLNEKQLRDWLGE